VAWARAEPHGAKTPTTSGPPMYVSLSQKRHAPRARGHCTFSVKRLRLYLTCQAAGLAAEGGPGGPYVCDTDGFACSIYNVQAYDNGSKLLRDPRHTRRYFIERCAVATRLSPWKGKRPSGVRNVLPKCSLTCIGHHGYASDSTAICSCPGCPCAGPRRVC